MIVKLGDGYFDRDAIAAIVPMNPPRFKVVLTSGAMVGLEVDGDVGEELEKAGVLELIQEPVREYDFTESEVVQLGESLRAGYRWAAKDRNLMTFAYATRPRKGNASWDAGESSIPLRLKGRFLGLDFDDPEPLDIRTLLQP